MTKAGGELVAPEESQRPSSNCKPLQRGEDDKTRARRVAEERGRAEEEEPGSIRDRRRRKGARPDGEGGGVRAENGSARQLAFSGEAS